MKLPQEYNRLDHNRYLEKIAFTAKNLADDMPPSLMQVTDKGMQAVCMGNIKQLKALRGMIEYVELAIEEILQLRDER